MKSWFCALSLLFASTPALPVTFTVNATGDVHDSNPGNGVCEAPAAGTCTLRAALDEANATTGATIQIPAGTFTLTLGSLTVQTPTTFVGAGAAATTIGAGNASSVFYVPGTSATFQKLTIRDGNAGSGTGGGINGVFATLVVDSCVVTSCTALYGAGVSVSGDGSSVTLSKTTITDCHVSGLTASGGALYVNGTGSATSCTFSGNSAESIGGAVFVENGGAFDLVNDTVSGNTANVGGGVAVNGVNADVRLFNTTVVSNTGTTQGGGITGVQGTLGIANSIVAGNRRIQGVTPVDDDCSGSITSNGSNIVQTVDAGHCIVTGAVSSTPPAFGSLQDNGGPTKTHALLSGSAGIDAATACTNRLGSPIATDQRGVVRPVGVKCDYGAYERAPCGDANGNGSFDVTDVFFVINYLFAGGAAPPGLANVNGDSAVNVSDAFYMINALFAGGAAPSCPGT